MGPRNFINLYMGSAIDYDGAYGVQCVDGFKVFCEWAGIPVKATTNGWANGYWIYRDELGFSQWFDYIYDPKELRNGDWCIWDKGSSCPLSHIAMYYNGQYFGERQGGGNEFRFMTLQNDIMGALRWKGWDRSTTVDGEKYLCGIDISNHQGRNHFDLEVVKDQFDFAIVKSTEGIGFVDPYCDIFVQWCIDHKKPWGFYHFGRPGNDPIKEADFWYENTKNYFGKGLPVLDIEEQNPNVVAWCYKFLSRIIDLTGIKPVVYMSEQSFEWAYDWSAVVSLDCGLWCAAYRTSDPFYELDESQTYAYGSPKPKHWPFICMWQYTSNGHLAGYEGNLDFNIFYGNEKVWMAYVTSGKDAPWEDSLPIPEQPKPIEEDNTMPKPVDTNQNGGDTTPQANPTPDFDVAGLFGMSNRVYDILKYIALIGIPAVVTLIMSLGSIWGIPNYDRVATTVSALGVFLGSLLLVSSRTYAKNKERQGNE